MKPSKSALLILGVLFCTPCAFAQNSAADDAAGNATARNARPDATTETAAGDVAAFSQDDAASIAAAYARNRERFQEQRADLGTELERLDEAIKTSEATLQALRDERSHLQNLAAEQSLDGLDGLRATTRSVETATFLALQPLPVVLSRFFDRAETGDAGQQFLGIGSDTVSLYLSFMLPVTILLGLYFTSRVYRDFYRARRKHLQLAALSLMLLLPLSSFAQETPAESVPTQEDPTNGEPPLKDIFKEADQVLSLTRVQRYIKQLTEPDAQGKRIRVTGVDLSETPFAYFDSVVGGSGEYHATLAALYLADGNRDAAIRQLRALARPGTRYATQNSDPERYESLFASAVVFLLQNGAPELAENIVGLHMQDLYSVESFEKIYPELVSNSLNLTAGELAQQIIDQTSETDQLIAYARTLYDSGSIAQARASLNKAMRNVESAFSLEQIIDIGLSQEEESTVEAAVQRAPELIDDLAILVSVSDRLRESGWTAAGAGLLEGAIARTEAREFSTVNSAPVPATEALTFLSYQSFERGLLEIAEKAAIAAIKPLSRAERSELVMSAPPGVLDPLRVPEPEKLVSPLYFGLLYENQGRTDAARQRFAAESRALVESMLESDGLYVPDMINHLSLLGSMLDAQDESAELAQLDRVLVRLESRALEELRASHAEAIDSRQSQLDSTQEQIAALRADIDTLNYRLEGSGADKLGLALSAILLILRNLSLLAVCCICAVAIVTLALRYAALRSGHKSHAFWWKMIEGLGWLWVLSLFSAPLGMLAIVSAQFFLLYQLRNERLIALTEAAQSTPAQPNPVENDTGFEPEWRNVIQMLRETRNSRAG